MAGASEKRLKGVSGEGLGTDPISMVPPVRSGNSPNKEAIDNSFTSITSPIRRIPSFIDEEEDLNESNSPSRLGNNLSIKSSPNSAINKRKRNHQPHPHENNSTQFNRSQCEEYDEFESLNEEDGQSKNNYNLKVMLIQCFREEIDESRVSRQPIEKKAIKTKPKHTNSAVTIYFFIIFLGIPLT